MTFHFDKPRAERAGSQLSIEPTSVAVAALQPKSGLREVDPDPLTAHWALIHYGG